MSPDVKFNPDQLIFQGVSWFKKTAIVKLLYEKHSQSTSIFFSGSVFLINVRFHILNNGLTDNDFRYEYKRNFRYASFTDFHLCFALF